MNEKPHLTWNPGAPKADTGAAIQVTDRGVIHHAQLEDIEMPAQELAQAYLDSEHAGGPHRIVQFQRFVCGTPHGNPWTTEMAELTEDSPGDEEPGDENAGRTPGDQV